MKVLFATTNPAKIKKYASQLKERGIEVLTIKDLKIDWNDNYGLVLCPNLTYQSCINILNGLWDFRGNGDANTTRTLKVHSNFITTVGDEISIATEKGLNITA